MAVLALIPLFFIVRAALIMFGLYKSPVLHSFERYGDEETLYHPILEFLGALVVLAIGTQFYIGMTTRTQILMFIALMLGSFIGMMWYRFAAVARRLLDRHLIIPRWYRDLYQRTTRVERRRIAYMWLRLPRRTRATLETNTPAFMDWADLVIMGAVMEEDE